MTALPTSRYARIIKLGLAAVKAWQRWRKKAAILLVAMLSCGCATSRPTVSVPSQIKPQYDAASASAMVCLRQQGLAPGSRQRGVVETRRGERQIGGWWCWNQPGLGNVAGTFQNTRPWRITVAAAPDGSVRSDVLAHESGHRILYEAGVPFAHTPTYRQCFVNWRAEGMQEVRDGNRIILVIMEDAE